MSIQIENFDVQNVSISAPFERVFSYIADPANLPRWTNAFAKADETSAVMVTPNGELKIGLKTKASKEHGTVDWYMTMPDGSIGAAFSRATPNGSGTVYTFVLMAPPVPVEQIEGTLKQQKEILRKELEKLKGILEGASP
ncbi:SRPBCC family protein [Nitrososphaera sp.]|uniref:SRPBCC family protein n=1 Tax=Nitrososphaera sp. TaxID=1971748 RepID=UPI00316DBE33